MVILCLMSYKSDRQASIKKSFNVRLKLDISEFYNIHSLMSNIRVPLFIRGRIFHHG